MNSKAGPPRLPVTRRQFLKLTGVSSAAALLPISSWLSFADPAEDAVLREFSKAGLRRRYSSKKHLDARMHLGGIGTGNFEIGPDGRLTTWQIFNTYRRIPFNPLPFDGSIPFYFCVRAGQVAKLLQTTEGPDWPRVREIEMTAEYPFATLRYQDDELPVNLELTAYTPFKPLDTKFSSMPLAIFNFRIHNPTSKAATVSLAGMLANPIGYVAEGKIEGNSHPKFGGNINERIREPDIDGVFMRAEPGEKATLDRAVSIFVSPNLHKLLTPPPDRPANLQLEILRGQLDSPADLKNPAQTVFWLDDPEKDFSEKTLRRLQTVVEQGGTLVFSGAKMPLLQFYADMTGGHPSRRTKPRDEILFEDFENGYRDWQVEGQWHNSKLPKNAQQPVSGFIGKEYADSFAPDDSNIGKLTSKPFMIVRDFIHFRIGGGSYNDTAIRLLVDGKIVRTASGRNEEKLFPTLWNVRDLAGKTASLEIVDNRKGSWGHVNVDQIVFSDDSEKSDLIGILEELLPARFSGIKEGARKADDRVELELADAKLKDGAETIASETSSKIIWHKLGKGRVALACGQLLNPARADQMHLRQPAYATLCSLAGANFTCATGQSPDDLGFGTIALATSIGKTSALLNFENWSTAWEQFSRSGGFEVSEIEQSSPTAAGKTVFGALATTVIVPPGETVEVPFFFAWHYPNQYSFTNYKFIGTYYATLWENARAVAKDAVKKYNTLRTETEQFRRTFYESTLPYWLLDCLTANAGIIRHNGVVFRTADGNVFAWEGSYHSCDPTCTHVWGYEQTMACLFPDLERTMRRIDFKHQQRKDGGINNRLEVPLADHPTGERPFTDGHASCILKAYREALNSPDESFFREYWPYIERAMNYLIERDIKSANGSEPAGILQDEQWNTYDQALHGVTPFISGYYLAALRASEEWSKRLGDSANADRFRGIFEKGREKLMELCWNGEYFQQYLPDYMTRTREVGPGCMADQLIGQWWAHQLGLGYLLPQTAVVSALRSIYKYCFKPDLANHDWRNQRQFAGPEDKGLVNCAWPKGGRPPSALSYSEEVWTGIEYQVAGHMVYEGLIDEALTIAKAARDRYDGVPRPPIQRNPWSEYEAGGHYSRAMSSWSLLLALSGWEYDGPRRKLSFVPRHTPADFKSAFVAPEAWGHLRQSREGNIQRNEITVIHGALPLTELALTAHGTIESAKAECSGKPVRIEPDLNRDGLRLSFPDKLIVKENQTLTVEITVRA
ncbi:MAG TPA: GH116 family glycosyl-hydrolase [Verrucomicrobiae bacterium]|nr:GH116 family glycosyl-hydrolase [Verrucomicrobiae bacterium]